MPDDEPAVPPGDRPVVAPLRTLAGRSSPSLTVRLVVLIAVSGALLALVVGVVMVVAAFVVTATAG